MIEQQRINNKDVWIKIDTINMHRGNPDIIQTEYFTASYYFNEPASNINEGEIIKDDDEEIKRFESPVAALNFAEKMLEKFYSYAVD